MTTKFKVVIPARYGSTRLPGKPLIALAGKPMIAHVCDRAKEAEAEQIVVATDDYRIFDVVTELGIVAVMTSDSHQSGTERIAEVARQLKWHDDEIIVNLQGDEPLLSADYIYKVARVLSNCSLAKVTSLAVEINTVEEIFDSNIVKVVIDKQGHALYFSRAAIPWDRDGFAKQHSITNNIYLRHIGLYAYRVGFLNQYIDWQESPLERGEVLEQLRILWHGEKIRVDVVSDAPLAGIDTEEDVRRVEKYLQN
jgi:3-deoxy-manno-octulosonate cytidylyltransferase (CMP-KDO synthetase)